MCIIEQTHSSREGKAGDSRTSEYYVELVHGPEHLPDETVHAARRRVDLRADADQPAGHRELQLVRLGVQ